MNEQVIIGLISAGAGALFGALFSAYIPRLLYDPRLKIEGIRYHRSYRSYTILVNNRGKNAAINAVGRVTIRPIRKGDILHSREEILEARKKLPGHWRDVGDWRKSIDAWLSSEDWETGIEGETLFWAVYPNPTRTNINNGLPESLVLAYSDGPWVDIASSTFRRKLARLSLSEGREYIGEVVVGAENAKRSRPFRFKIRLGPDGKALITPYKGPLPAR